MNDSILTEGQVVIRQMEERDLHEADRIMRLAFGTFLGLPDPSAFMGDGDYVRTRWSADASAAWVAEIDGELLGSNFGTRWGSVAFFGPLSVHPDLWDRGVAKQLLATTMVRFSDWAPTHAGLFTFPQSAKHLHLYQKLDFWPRFLTPIMGKEVATPARRPRWSRFSEASSAQQRELLDRCRRFTDAIYPGLDLAREIQAAQLQKLGETVLLWRDQDLAGFAVCHVGAGTEAGSGACYVKFGAVRNGAVNDFADLLDACELLAADESASRLVAGVNMGHHRAYRELLDRGFRTEFEGGALHRGNDAGYRDPAVFVIDDWR